MAEAHSTAPYLFKLGPLTVTKQGLQRATPYFFLTPAALVLITALLYPVIYGLRLSLYEWALRDLRKPPIFRGLENFVDLFKSPNFQTSVQVTLKFTLTVVIVEILLGLAIALLLEEKMKGLRVFRTIFVLPIMVAPVVVGIVWRFLYDPSYGLLNYFLGKIGIAPKLWLAEPTLALKSIIITDIWQWTPFVFLLLLAALQGIPRSFLEAAYVDGANYWQTFFLIKLPLMKSIIGITAALRLIDAFRGLVVMYIMTFGGPGMSTEILSMHLYKTAFNSQRLGLASAIAVILLGIIFVITIVMVIVFRTQQEEDYRKR
ncbi:MAG: sugar ABC transporter permease [bacterium]|nr:sugar ABC transporter permease [bacterium]